MKNALSVDLECWYSPELLIKYLPETFKCQAIEANNKLLELLNKYNTKVTFFVLGNIAENNPDYIKMLHEEGHEICSHSYTHDTLHRLGKNQFEEELKKSTNLIKSITHEQPLGFRAPTFSVDQSTSWVFELLKSMAINMIQAYFPSRRGYMGFQKLNLLRINLM